MNDHLATVEDRLLDTMEAADRGPRQNGLFALWLFVRQCEGMLPPHRLTTRVLDGRLDRLERRLSSLSLPAPLRRALPGSIRELRVGELGRVAIALQQLAAPVREVLGPSLGDAFAQVARRTRQAARRAARSAGAA